jgi:transposase-like protein
MSKWKKDHPELTRSSIVAEIPRACSDETATVEFLEKQRWLGVPACAHCGSEQVYQMQDASGGRNRRFLWRCKNCKRQFTVRVGTIFEDSKLPLRHWCYAYWRACSSKKGVAALEIQRHCQITYSTKSGFGNLHPDINKGILHSKVM